MTRALLIAAVALTGCLDAKAAAPPSAGPIVVAAVDIPAGTLVTFDMISQRQVAPAFITSSVVKPDSASYIVNQRIGFPVLAGDPMLWSFFETTSDTASHEACRRVMPAQAADAPGQISQTRAVALQR